MSKLCSNRAAAVEANGHVCPYGDTGICGRIARNLGLASEITGSSRNVLQVLFMCKLTLLMCIGPVLLAQTGGHAQLTDATAREVIQKTWQNDRLYVGLGPMAVVGGMGVMLGDIKPNLLKGTISQNEFEWYKTLQTEGLVRITEGPELAKQFTNWSDWNQLTQQGIQKRLLVTPLERAEPFGCDSNGAHITFNTPAHPAGSTNANNTKSEDGTKNSGSGKRVHLNWRALVQPPQTSAAPNRASSNTNGPQGPQQFLCIPRGSGTVDRIVRIMNSSGTVKERALVLGTYHRNWTPEALLFQKAIGSAVLPVGKFAIVFEYDPFKSEWQTTPWFELVGLNEEFRDNLIERFEHNALPAK
jgi:hypothetical protein